jgi:hypothetical protein
MRFEQLALKEEMMREKDDERNIQLNIEKEKEKQVKNFKSSVTLLKISVKRKMHLL